MRTEEWIFYTACERLFFKKQFRFVGHSVIHNAFTVDNSIQEHACLTVEIVSYCLQPRSVKIVSNVRNVQFCYSIIPFGEIWLNMWYLQDPTPCENSVNVPLFMHSSLIFTVWKMSSLTAIRPKCEQSSWNSHGVECLSQGNIFHTLHWFVCCSDSPILSLSTCKKRWKS